MKKQYPYISKLKVLESAAGFYVGRVYNTSESYYEPYSRESGYMATREIAEYHLENKSYIEIL